MSLDRLASQQVKLPNRGGILQAVAQSGLPIGDCFDIIVEARQYGLLRYVENELIVDRHSRQQGFQLEILIEDRLIRWQGPLEIEIASPVHQKSFHDCSRSSN